MATITIIVTVYNTKKEILQRCFDSIIAQTCHDYDVIVIDDGSQDVFAKELDFITSQISNIQVIHQHNAGVSAARNFGVKLAKGEFVTFVDGDDVISPYMIENAIDAIKMIDADIYYGLRTYVENYNDKFWQTNFKKFSKISCTRLDEKGTNDLYGHMLGDYKNAFVVDSCYISQGANEKIIRRILALNCKFEETIEIGEDNIWNLELLKYRPSIVICNSLWYLYIKNPQSATKIFREKCLIQYSDYLMKLRKYVTDDSFEYLYLETTLRCIGEISESYFCASEYPNNCFYAIWEFNQLVKIFPWNCSFKLRYILQLEMKKKIKCLLILIGLWIPIYKHKKYILNN